MGAASGRWSVSWLAGLAGMVGLAVAAGSAGYFVGHDVGSSSVQAEPGPTVTIPGPTTTVTKTSSPEPRASSPDETADKLSTTGDDPSVSAVDQPLPDGKQLFVKACPPYEKYYTYRDYLDGKTFQMSGQARTNGFTISAWNSFVISNFGPGYTRLEFDVGHQDETEMSDVAMTILLDGNVYKRYEIKADELPQHVAVPVDGKSQIKFLFAGLDSTSVAANAGLADMTIE